MNSEILKTSADGATTLAVGLGASSYLGAFDFINTNAPGIGIILSFVFGVIGLFFYWLTWKKSTLADENKKDLEDFKTDFDEHKTDTSKQFNSLNQGIDNILDKLDK